MEKQRRTKKVILAEELAEKIRNGQIAPGSEFPTTEELMRRYKISSGTAGKLAHQLAGAGLLDVSRGRRTLVRAVIPEPAYSRFAKPIGVISPSMEFFRQVRWREWLVHHIQRRLLAHDNQSLWLPDDFCPVAADANVYSGFIFAGELVPAKVWENALATGLPCVKISFQQPYPNSVYVDYRAVMHQAALRLIELGCKRVICLGNSEKELTEHAAWCRRIDLIPVTTLYGVSEYDYTHVKVTPGAPDGMDALRREILSRPEKMAIFAGTTTFNRDIIDIMSEFGRNLGEDYEIFALSHVPQELTVGHYVDLKVEKMVEKLIHLFDRQHITGQSQIAEIIYPELILP